MPRWLVSCRLVVACLVHVRQLAYQIDLPAGATAGAILWLYRAKFRMTDEVALASATGCQPPPYL